MNQILVTENNKKRKSSRGGPVAIKGVVRFFAFSSILFGLILSGEGCYALYKDADAKKPGNIPSITIGRVNDQAVIRVEHNVEIVKIIYSWDQGEETILPVNALTTQENITLLGYDSTLNLTVEDINGKRVSYQKQYKLNGVDITKPTIEIETENGNNKMFINAKDDTELAYISYQWGDEEPVIVETEEEGQTEIYQELTLTPGTKTIKVIAEDANGNVETIEKDIVTSTSKPEMYIIQDNGKISIQAKDKDGIKKITVNLNGEVSSIDDVNQKEVTVGVLQLREGNNTISIEVTNVSGYTESATTELQYTP